MSCAAFFFFGLAVGVDSSDDREQVAQPVPSTRVVTKTKEVEREVKVPFVPADCQEALDMVPDLLSLIDKYEASLGEEDKILADAYTAMNDQDTEDLNDVVTRQRQMKVASLGHLLDIRSKSEDISKAVQRCESKKD